MRREHVWRHIHTERRYLAEALAAIPAAAWRQSTLCAGWTVHDIAAHVISHPKLRVRHMAVMLGRNLGHGYNEMIFRSVKQLAAKETREGILADFARYDGSTKHVPGTSHLDALVDVLVHTQDILRPLNLIHDMPPDAAAAAADRAHRKALIMGWRGAAQYRLTADDVDWARGQGPAINGPMEELLMISTGRPPSLAHVSGEGLELLQTRLRPLR